MSPAPILICRVFTNSYFYTTLPAVTSGLFYRTLKNQQLLYTKQKYLQIHRYKHLINIKDLFAQRNSRGCDVFMANF